MSLLRSQDEVFSQMPLKELLQQLHVAVEDLAALDASLTALFDGAPNTDVTEHQQLVQVRFNSEPLWSRRKPPANHFLCLLMANKEGK